MIAVGVGKGDSRVVILSTCWKTSTRILLKVEGSTIQTCQGFKLNGNMWNTYGHRDRFGRHLLGSNYESVYWWRGEEELTLIHYPVSNYMVIDGYFSGMENWHEWANGCLRNSRGMIWLQLGNVNRFPIKRWNKEWELRSHGWVFFHFPGALIPSPQKLFDPGPICCHDLAHLAWCPCCPLLFSLWEQREVWEGGSEAVTLHLQHLQVCDKVRLFDRHVGNFLGNTCCQLLSSFFVSFGFFKWVNVNNWGKHTTPYSPPVWLRQVVCLTVAM